MNGHELREVLPGTVDLRRDFSSRAGPKAHVDPRDTACQLVGRLRPEGVQRDSGHPITGERAVDRDLYAAAERVGEGTRIHAR